MKVISVCSGAKSVQSSKCALAVANVKTTGTGKYRWKELVYTAWEGQHPYNQHSQLRPWSETSGLPHLGIRRQMVLVMEKHSVLKCTLTLKHDGLRYGGLFDTSCLSASATLSRH